MIPLTDVLHKVIYVNKLGLVRRELFLGLLELRLSFVYLGLQTLKLRFVLKAEALDRVRQRPGDHLTLGVARHRGDIRVEAHRHPRLATRNARIDPTSTPRRRAAHTNLRPRPGDGSQPTAGAG